VIIRDSIVKAIVQTSVDLEVSVDVNREKRRVGTKLRIFMHRDEDSHISKLNAQEHESTVVTFQAKVSNWAKVRSITIRAMYKCPECEYTKETPFVTKTREKCDLHRVALEFYKPTESEDTRRIVLREIIDDYSTRDLPSSMSADIYGQTVKDVQLSEKLVVTGIFRSVPLEKENGKLSKQFIPTIQIVSVRNLNDGKVEMPSDELLEKLQNLESADELVNEVIKGFAYNIYGKTMEKKAVLCSLIGSKWIGQVGKGNPPMIHILFVGDPDTYKSTIMKYISNVCDHCVLADSTTVSNAGIKAIAVKMDDGRWSIRAGLLPEYSGGNVFLDEFGDLKADIYADLKAPMIDGTVSKHVAGEEFQGKAETGILASMNPTEGVYDTSKTIYENIIKLEKPLITRFDGIFVFTKSSPDYNSMEIRKHFKETDLHGKSKDLLTDLEIKLLLNYVRNIDPELTQEAIDTSNDFFAELEKKGGEKGGTETRAENAVLKFAVALSKWHLCKEVKKEHVIEALELYAHSMKTMDLDFKAGELLNLSRLIKTADAKQQHIRKCYDRLKDEDGYVFQEELEEEVLKTKIFESQSQLQSKIEQMKLVGKISTKNNMIKITWA
jgi:DNA replicative helicase MCM subunit Mcm2 (Cdc46/Mcm family)